jgi:thiol-disulfide isomerase/thioredoxin
MGRLRRVWLASAVIAIALPGCGPASPDERLYEAEFGTQPPTRVLVERLPEAWVVRNGAERITLNQVGPGVYRVPVFGGSWVGAWAGEEWGGVWVDSLRPNDYKVPLKLRPLRDKVEPTQPPIHVSTWRTTEGLLHLRTRGDSAWGTISTPTGDYRYLAGKVENNSLIINAFDGAHLFRFYASVRNDSLVQGSFLSGTHYRTDFGGVRVDSELAEWKSASQIPAASVLSFSGINVHGDTVFWTSSNLSERGKKGAVVDVLGSWCPNCMDEVRLLKELAPEYPEIEFVSLAFERTTDEDALRRLSQFQQEMDFPWAMLLGGRASKTEAAAAISALDTVHSFPTTMFWPAASGSPHVHKGFNGPATGPGYAAEKITFRDELNRLSGRSENR